MLKEILESLPEIRWRKFFPYPVPRPAQVQAIKRILEVLTQRRGIVLELRTGTGKSGLGVWFLRLMQGLGVKGALVIVTPTKNLTDQYKKEFPDHVDVVYGRGEYDCEFYKAQGKPAKADAVPCLTLVRNGLCPHYVPSLANVPTDVTPCGYYLAKRTAAEGGNITVCTTAYFLLNRLYNHQPDPIAGLVIDEADRIAQDARLIFAYNISDYHLKNLIEFLKHFHAPTAAALRMFLMHMIKIAKLKPALKPTLLEPHEIQGLLEKLEAISFEEVKAILAVSLQQKLIDPVEHAEELKTLEEIEFSLRRYIKSFWYALEKDGRRPLNYIFSFFQKEGEDEEVQPRVRYRLCVRAHYVAPLIATCLEGIERVVAYSADIGEEKPFQFETGIRFKVHSFPSPFSSHQVRVYLPTDTPNLAAKKRGPSDLAMVIARTAAALIIFQKRGLRSLMTVESEEERTLFLEFAKQQGLDVITYGQSMNARQALTAFQEGKGMVLAGTSAHYARGIDLPGSIARVSIGLRPSYPRLDDPATQFEVSRFTEAERWSVWNWRAGKVANQLVGRNVRDDKDKGVTIFISQHYRHILPSRLADWLQESWVQDKSFDECIQDALAFLKKS